MIKKFFSICMIFVLGACASIVSKSQWPVSISSSPESAKFTITNKNGQVIHSGQTPASITLNSGDGYFSKATYIIKYEKSGFETKTYELTPTLNGWYWGNIALGGLIGMLIVDPISGAMYKLPEVANVSLDSEKKHQGKKHSDNGELKILSLNDISAEQKSKLIRIN